MNNPYVEVFGKVHSYSIHDLVNPECSVSHEEAYLAYNETTGDTLGIVWANSTNEATDILIKSGKLAEFVCAGDTTFCECIGGTHYSLSQLAFCEVDNTSFSFEDIGVLELLNLIANYELNKRGL